MGSVKSAPLHSTGDTNIDHTQNPLDYTDSRNTQAPMPAVGSLVVLNQPIRDGSFEVELLLLAGTQLRVEGQEGDWLEAETFDGEHILIAPGTWDVLA